MRKLVLITALLLASASAHAGSDRGLLLAAADTPAVTDTAPAAPLPPGVTADAPKPAAAEPAKPETAKPAKRVRHESDEAKARRIAARYGVYW